MRHEFQLYRLVCVIPKLLNIHHATSGIVQTVVIWRCGACREVSNSLRDADEWVRHRASS